MFDPSIKKEIVKEYQKVLYPERMYQEHFLNDHIISARKDAMNFIRSCLIKNKNVRPTSEELKNMPFVKNSPSRRRREAQIRRLLKHVPTIHEERFDHPNLQEPPNTIPAEQVRLDEFNQMYHEALMTNHHIESRRLETEKKQKIDELNVLIAKIDSLKETEKELDNRIAQKTEKEEDLEEIKNEIALEADKSITINNASVEVFEIDNLQENGLTSKLDEK
uniref:Uncharacterized protein n=1 Tax=Acrobeloides nanus TaxID=290746 RepID=A0A914E716_9BILA